jgi:hypothetical protein
MHTRLGNGWISYALLAMFNSIDDKPVLTH